MYTRRDPVTARLVYKAQLILRLLGPAPAFAFMKGMGMDAALIQRVLRSPRGMLRR